MSNRCSHVAKRLLGSSGRWQNMAGNIRDMARATLTSIAGSVPRFA